MKFVGTYKIYKMIQNMGDHMELVDVESVLASKTEPDEIRELQRSINQMLYITEDGLAYTVMPIPEGAPKEEIEKAEAAGQIINGMVKLGRPTNVKEEDGALYFEDPSRVLTGEEWFKVSTEVEGEINMVTMAYMKI